jgi:hypothetical protein
VGRWAVDNGFSLTPDAPEVLDFYAARSPVFMAAKFDATEAARRGLERGEGTSIHLAIPTDDPWVPLRILALGQSGEALVKADVFLLTDQEPSLLPGPGGLGASVERDGLQLVRNEPASQLLLSDLRSDRGMGWLPPDGMWLTYLQVREEAQDLRYDLAIDTTGAGQPSPVDAGLLLGDGQQRHIGEHGEGGAAQLLRLRQAPGAQPLVQLLVPIGRAATAALHRYIHDGRPELAKRRGGPALFLSARGGRLSRQSAWKLVKRYAAKGDAGEDVFPHALRHSFATHMMARGADVRVVQEALGHARLSTTQVYTLVTRQKLKDVYETAHPRGRARKAPSGDGTHEPASNRHRPSG